MKRRGPSMSDMIELKCSWCNYRCRGSRRWEQHQRVCPGKYTPEYLRELKDQRREKRHGAL